MLTQPRISSPSITSFAVSIVKSPSDTVNDVPAGTPVQVSSGYSGNAHDDLPPLPPPPPLAELELLAPPAPAPVAEDTEEAAACCAPPSADDPSVHAQSTSCAVPAIAHTSPRHHR